MTSQTKYSVVQILDGYRYGGAEGVALSYSSTLDYLGVKNEILAYDVKQRPASGSVRLFSGRLRQFFGIIARIRQSPTIIFCHTIRGLVMCSLIHCLFANSSQIVFIRHFPFNGKASKLLLVFRYFIHRLFLITPAQEVNARKIFGNKVYHFNNYVIPAIPVASADQLKESVIEFANGRKIIAFCGAMKQGKSPADIISLISKLDTTQFCCVLIGDGPLMQSTKDAFFKLHDPSAAFFTGYLSSPHQVLQVCDYMFFPSWNNYEMMPMVLLEAIDAGCICFAYNLQVNTYILPASNLFPHQDFDAICHSITNNCLQKIPPIFNESYGLDRMQTFLRSIHE